MPTTLFKAYSDGKITRDKFIYELRTYQQLNGLDYECRGRADKYGTHFEYRGVIGTINNGAIHFILEHRKGFKKCTALNETEFCRMIDFHINKQKYPYGI